uniref:Uncharacterized protein n=1 Tax=Ceratitis capitata TaxID=7213 RepID=W8AEP6_CERCA
MNHLNHNNNNQSNITNNNYNQQHAHQHHLHHNHHQHHHHHQQLPPQPSQQLQQQQPAVHEAEEAKLISLDTPQPTPTTIQPPLSFCSQLDGITLDPAALNKSLQQHKLGAGIGLVAPTSSYANIQLMKVPQNNCMMASVDAAERPIVDGDTTKSNGAMDASLQNGPVAVVSNGVASVNGNGVALVGADSAVAAPFTIQGYNERHKDQHAEISC